MSISPIPVQFCTSFHRHTADGTFAHLHSGINARNLSKKPHWGTHGVLNYQVIDLQHHTSLSDTSVSPAISRGDSVSRRVAISPQKAQNAFKSCCVFCVFCELNCGLRFLMYGKHLTIHSLRTEVFPVSVSVSPCPACRLRFDNNPGSTRSQHIYGSTA